MVNRCGCQLVEVIITAPDAHLSRVTPPRKWMSEGKDFGMSGSASSDQDAGLTRFRLHGPTNWHRVGKMVSRTYCE